MGELARRAGRPRGHAAAREREGHLRRHRGARRRPPRDGRLPGPGPRLRPGQLRGGRPARRRGLGPAPHRGSSISTSRTTTRRRTATCPPARATARFPSLLERGRRGRVRWLLRARAAPGRRRALVRLHRPRAVRRRGRRPSRASSTSAPSPTPESSHQTPNRRLDHRSLTPWRSTDERRSSEPPIVSQGHRGRRGPAGPGPGAGPRAPKPEAAEAADFKISLAEWSLHKALFAKKIDNLDFPKIAREQYGIEGVEFVNQFFKDKAHDSAYLKDLKTRANDHGVTCVLIMIDGEGDLSAPDKAERDKAVENHKKWVDAAAALGCHSIRVNTGEHYSPTDVGAVAEACSALDRVRRQAQDRRHLREPRRPVEQPRRADRPDEGRGQAELRHPPRLRQLPQGRDGKYKIDIYDAIARMMPYAKGVSAKSYDFDEKGKETTLDYAADHEDRHRRRLSRLRRHRVRREPAERARGDQGHQEAARGDPPRDPSEATWEARLPPSGLVPRKQAECLPARQEPRLPPRDARHACEPPGDHPAASLPVMISCT